MRLDECQIVDALTDIGLVMTSLSASRLVGRDLRRSRRGWFEPDPIIDSVVEALFASKVALGCLHRDMSQQELYLL